ncbi:MAG: zinc ribbon domain-containing protein [Armatimonadota bacterium]
MPRKITIQKTAVFKLHNPGASKRQVLDVVFARYGEAYNLMLERSRATADRWVSERRNGMRPRPLSPFSAAKELRPLAPPSEDLKLPGALRDGLVSDVAGNLVSYCELRQQWETRGTEGEVVDEPKYPAPLYAYRPDQYLQTLAEASAWGGDHFDFRDFQSRLLREAKDVVRPLFFARQRDFELQQFADDRWGITLHLQPKGCEPTKLRFPLAFGEWHEEQYLGVGKAGCARLCRRDREYYIHVSFEFEIEAMARGEEQCYLGIDRGVIKQAAYALVGLDGKLVHTGALGRETRQLQVALGRYRQAAQKAGRRMGALDWQRRHQEELLHQIANDLVEQAAAQKALIVMEKLDLHTGGAFVRSQFAKLARILDYKARQAGLLPPRDVFAAYSSLICSACGEDGTRGDPDRETFRCSQCGAIMDADENAAVNIARRILYRKAAWERRGGYRAFHRSFASVV